MSACVLDASALIAMLKEEAGATRVVEMLSDARISAVNWAEVVSHFIHLGMPLPEVDAMLRPLPLTILSADQSLAVTAGELRAMTASAGLSLGDRFCLALALRDGVPAITADRQWAMIADAIGAEIEIIR